MGNRSYQLLRTMKYLILFLFLIYLQLAFPQVNKGVQREFIIGGVLPLGKDISRIYNQGGSAEVRLSKDLGKMITIKPYLSYSIFGNKPGTSLKEYLHFFSLGVNPNFRFSFHSTFKTYFGPSLNINYYFDRLISKDFFYRSLEKKKNTLISDILVSYDLRLGIVYKRYLAELNYRPYNSIPHINKEVVDAIEYSDDLYQYYKIRDRKFNFSMISLSIGILF
jgi:hypothetical protein